MDMVYIEYYTLSSICWYSMYSYYFIYIYIHYTTLTFYCSFSFLLQLLYVTTAKLKLSLNTLLKSESKTGFL